MQIAISGVDRSYLYTPSELEGIELVFAADNGEVGVGTVPLPQADNTTEPYSGQRFLVTAGAQTIFDGFVGAMSRDRGGIPGARMTYYHSIGDENGLLGGHRAVKWVRPAELDRSRMLAANTDFLGYLGLDTSWVLNTNNETIPAKTYMTEDIFGELQDDCGGPTAKTLFIVNRELHWHRQTEGATAGLTIVASGANRTTTFELESVSPPNRQKDPMDLVTDVLARNPSTGAFYQDADAAAQALHDADGIRHQRLIEQDGATVAQLTSLVNRQLSTFKKERITYEGTLGPLTPAQVKLIPVGSLMTVTDPVWGLTASVQRIAGLRLRYRHPDQFIATLELGYRPRLRVRPLKTTGTSSLGSSAPVDCCPPFDGSGTPEPGQPVNNELIGFGNGTTTAFTTLFPYAPFSLRVWVDNINVAVSLTETNPATGAFTLDFAPTTGERIVAYYSGHA